MKIEIQFMVTATIEFCEADLNQEVLQQDGQQAAIEAWVADNAMPQLGTYDYTGKNWFVYISDETSKVSWDVPDLIEALTITVEDDAE